MDMSPLDNTVSPDHNQLAQSSPQDQVNSPEVFPDSILDNTNINGVDTNVHSEID